MKEKRKIELVAKKMSFAEEEDADIEYWANLPVIERMRQAFDWNKQVWKHILKNEYSEKIQRTGEKKIKTLTDEDDF